MSKFWKKVVARCSFFSFKPKNRVEKCSVFSKIWDNTEVFAIPSAVMQYQDTDHNKRFGLNQYIGYSGRMFIGEIWWQEIYLEWMDKNFAYCTPAAKAILDTVGVFFKSRLGINEKLRYYACETGTSANYSAIAEAIACVEKPYLICTSTAHRSILESPCSQKYILPVREDNNSFAVPVDDIQKILNEHNADRDNDNEDNFGGVIVITLGATHSGAIDVSGLTTEVIKEWKSKKIWIHVDAILGGARAAVLPSFSIASRNIKQMLSLINPDSVSVGIYKALGVVSASLVFIDPEKIKETSIYFLGGTGLRETSISSPPFAFAAKTIEQTPVEMLQLLNYFAHYAAAFFVGMLREFLSRQSSAKHDYKVGLVYIDAVFIELNKVDPVIELLRAVNIEVAQAEFQTENGVTRGIRIVFKPLWIWDSTFVGVLAFLVGAAILYSENEIDEISYLQHVEQFKFNVQTLQETRLQLSDGEVDYLFPNEFFSLLRKHNVFSSDDTLECAPRFEKFLAEYLSHPISRFRPYDWPDSRWMGNLKTYLRHILCKNNY